MYGTYVGMTTSLNAQPRFMMILRFARWPAEHAKVKVLKYIQYVEIGRIVENIGFDWK